MARNANTTPEAKNARLAAIDEARRAKQEQYWLDRSQSRIRATDREADAVKRDHDRAYKTARHNVQREVDKVYRGIGAAAGMSEEDARQRLSQSELKDFKEELARKRDIIKDMIAKDPNNEELKKYDTEWENLSKVRELTRKEALQINIETEIAQLGGKQQMSIDKHASNVVSTSLKMNASDLDMIGGVQAKLGVGSPEQVERAAKENWQHGDFSDRIWADKEKLIKETREVIENGFARNKGATDMATDLMNRMNVSHSNALRVVRTEFNHLSNQASLEEYKRTGIKKYKFVAAIDNRTCDVCHELHGKEFLVSEAKTGVNFPPIHPNCRSVTAPVIDWGDEDLWDFSGIELDDSDLAELGMTSDEVKELDADSAAPKSPYLNEFESARKEVTKDFEDQVKSGKLPEHLRSQYISAHMHAKLDVYDHGIVSEDEFEQIAKKDKREAIFTALFEVERLEKSRLDRDVDRWKDNERVQKRWAKSDAMENKLRNFLDENGVYEKHPVLTVEEANKAAEDTESVIRRAEQAERIKAQTEALVTEIRHQGESINSVEARLDKFDEQQQRMMGDTSSLSIAAIDAEQLESIAINLKAQELDVLKLQERVAKLDNTVPKPDSDQIRKLATELETSKEKRAERTKQDLSDSEIVKQALQQIDVEQNHETAKTAIAAQSTVGKALERLRRGVKKNKQKLIEKLLDFNRSFHPAYSSHNDKTGIKSITQDQLIYVDDWNYQRALIKLQLEENNKQFGSNDTRTEVIKGILEGKYGDIPNFSLACEVAELQYTFKQITGKIADIEFTDNDKTPGIFIPREGSEFEKIIISRNAKPSVLHHEMTHALQYFHDRRILGNDKNRKYEKNWFQYISNHKNRVAGKKVWKMLTRDYSDIDYLPGEKADKALMKELFGGKSWSELKPDERSIMHAFREIHASISMNQKLKYGHDFDEYGDLNIEAIASIKEILSSGRENAIRILHERYSELLNVVIDEWSVNK